MVTLTWKPRPVAPFASLFEAETASVDEKSNTPLLREDSKPTNEALPDVLEYYLFSALCYLGIEK
jgi:hypothetical protein